MNAPQHATHVAYHDGRIGRLAGLPAWQTSLIAAQHVGFAFPLQDAARTGWVATDATLARDARS